MRQITRTLLVILCVVATVFSVAACTEDKPGTEKSVIETPVIQSKAYNGEAQKATIAESDDYEVTTNEGGINAGEYDVVLTLKNANAAKWKTPDADDETKVTLKFVITKAANKINSLTLNGWAAGEEPEAPAATADFGTVKFTYSSEENGTYTETVPTAAGKYFVKAAVEGTADYDGAEKVLAFEITKRTAVVKTVPAARQNLLVAEDLSEQVLVTAGEAEGGIMFYALIAGEENVPSQELLNPEKWSTELPVASAAGKYTVYYMVKGDANHSDSEYGKVVAEIAKRDNAVADLTVNNIKYGETPAPTATATAGNIVYTYALTENGEYVSWETIEKRAGEYYVKATVAESDVYMGATATALFTVNKADNAIADFTVAAIKCHEMPELTATATAGTAVTYKYATEVGGEYADMPADGFVAGTYYVKAYTAGDGNYAAAESNAATLTVSHDLIWDKTGAEEDVEKCVCGHTGKTFVKAITEKNAQRIGLNVGVNEGTVVADEYAYGIVSLAGISDYVSVEAVKFGEKTITLNTFADEEELAGNKIALNAKDFGFAYGEQTVVVTVKCEGDDTHDVTVKVLLVTATIGNKAELNDFGVIAKACENEAGAWGGYFELGADIEYNDYWKDFFNAESLAALNAMQGFQGVFDGKGYNIKGLYVTQKSANSVGAFIARLGKNGVIRNVSFTNAQVGYDRSLLVYSGSGLIENVFVKYDIFGANNYNEYNKNHNWGQTSTMFAKGEETGAAVRNVIIDVSECAGVATKVDSVAGYIVGQCVKIQTYSNVYVVGASEKYNRYIRDNLTSTTEPKVETNFAPGTNYFVYKTFTEMANDTERNYDGFTGPLWIYKGGVPYTKAQVVKTPEFKTQVSEIAKGKSAEFIVSENAVLKLDAAATAAGLTLENGVVTVPAGIADATYVLTLTSVFDPEVKAEISFAVINPREYVNISKVHEIDLDVSNDGSVNSAKTVEIDLTEKFANNAALSLVKVGDELVNGFAGVAVTGGKVTLNVAGFGIKYYGNKELKLVFSSEGTDYEYTVPVRFITKTIMSGDENVRAIKTLVTALQGGGYYRLGENIKLSGAWFTASEDHRIGVDYAFAGTLDGQGYSLSGLKLADGKWRQGGFIQQLGENGVVKNIAFLDVRLGAAVSLIYAGSGTIENVYVQVAEMPANGDGAYSEGWRGNEAAIFGCRLTKNTFTVKNVKADFSAASDHISAYSDKLHAKLFGTFEASAKIENAVVTGMNKAVAEKVTNSAAVYVEYTDNTNNGVTFPASGWDETYWTVGENTVSWKTK